MSPSSGTLASISGHSLTDFRHVVFLGVYNAKTYADGISSWLPNLDIGDSALVVSDNCSTDSTVSFLLQILETSRKAVFLVENNHNFGGHGNLAINLPHFNHAQWITTLHQDDVYDPDHIMRHQTLYKTLGPDVGMVSTEARSVDQSGRTIPFPRAKWLLDSDADPVALFLANLKQHVFPFSGASFRREVLDRYPVPWHSTAFPDTELVMKMIADYRIVWSTGSTVKYLENPSSESHSLDVRQRDYGAFHALVRVFASNSFRKICESLQPDETDSFFTELESGIACRVIDAELRKALIQICFEISSQYLPLRERLASGLMRGYRDVGDSSAMKKLAPLTGLNLDDIPAQVTNKKAPSLVRFAKAITLGLLRVVPVEAQKKLLRRFVSLPMIRNKATAWNFNWPPKS